MKQALYVSLIGVLFVLSAIVISCSDNTINSSNEESGKFNKDANPDGGNYTDGIGGNETGDDGHPWWLRLNYTATDRYGNNLVPIYDGEGNYQDFSGNIIHGFNVQTLNRNATVNHSLQFVLNNPQEGDSLIVSYTIICGTFSFSGPLSSNPYSFQTSYFTDINAPFPSSLLPVIAFSYQRINTLTGSHTRVFHGQDYFNIIPPENYPHSN